MRKSFDGLSKLVHETIRQNPLAGHVFVFINKRSDRIKLLYWDSDGYAMWYKRLEKGTFTLPCKVGNDYQLEHRTLSMILEGIDFKNIHMKRRFKLNI